MVFNTTFNNISVISWRSVLLVEETRVPRKNEQTSHKSLTGITGALCQVHIKSTYWVYDLIYLLTNTWKHFSTWRCWYRNNLNVVLNIVFQLIWSCSSEEVKYGTDMLIWLSNFNNAYFDVYIIFYALCQSQNLQQYIMG